MLLLFHVHMIYCPNPFFFCVTVAFFCGLTHRYFLVLFFCSFSYWNCSPLLVWLSHKLSLTLLHRFKLETPFCCFLLSHCWLILTITLCRLSHTFYIYFSRIFSMELFHSSVTITQGPCSIYGLFPSGHSTLLFPFGSLMTHSHNYIVQTVTHFLLISKWSFTTFVCMTVTQVSCKCISIASKWTLSRNSSFLLCVTVREGPCNVSPLFWIGHATLVLPLESLLLYFSLIFSVELFPSCYATVTRDFYVFLLFPNEHSTLLLPFELLLTHSHNYIVWTATHIFFRLFFIDSFS